MGTIYFFSLNTSLLVGAPSDSSKGELPVSLKKCKLFLQNTKPKMLERIEVMLKLNETPIRTANNFRINNIEIDAQIPKIIPEFENVQIIKENSEIDEAVSNRELVFGNNKELENIVFSKANSKISFLFYRFYFMP